MTLNTLFNSRKAKIEKIQLISKYVDENEIVRPDDLVVKSTGANSALKLYIIQSLDRKLPLADIASAKGLDMDALMKEMEQMMNQHQPQSMMYFYEKDREYPPEYYRDMDRGRGRMYYSENGGSRSSNTHHASPHNDHNTYM